MTRTGRKASVYRHPGLKTDPPAPAPHRKACSA